MSYDNQYGQNRPGFSEVPGGGFPSSNGGYQQPQQGASSYGGAPQQPQAPTYQQSQQAPQQTPAYSSGGGSQGYQGSNNAGSGGYGGRSGGYGGNGGGGYRGGNGGGQRTGGWQGGGQRRQGGGGGFNRQPLTPEELAALKLPKAAVLAGNYGAPEQLVPLIREIADLLRQHGYEIRISAMDGFDKLVLDNVPGAEIHLPWKDFNQVQNAFSTFNSDECKEFAKRYMPDWSTVKESHQAFFAKNARLVLGKTCKQPCQISIIWSEDGVEGPANRGPRSAHAGHIAAISHAMNIPVINISNPNAVQRLRQFLEGNRNG